MWRVNRSKSGRVAGFRLRSIAPATQASKEARCPPTQRGRAVWCGNRPRSGRVVQNLGCSPVSAIARFTSIRGRQRRKRRPSGVWTHRRRSKRVLKGPSGFPWIIRAASWDRYRRPLLGLTAMAARLSQDPMERQRSSTGHRCSGAPWGRSKRTEHRRHAPPRACRVGNGESSALIRTADATPQTKNARPAGDPLARDALFRGAPGPTGNTCWRSASSRCFASRRCAGPRQRLLLVRASPWTCAPSRPWTRRWLRPPLLPTK